MAKQVKIKAEPRSNTGRSGVRKLKARGIIPDFRPPNVIRLAPVPLYTRYRDVGELVLSLKSIVELGEHLQFSEQREAVA